MDDIPPRKPDERRADYRRVAKLSGQLRQTASQRTLVNFLDISRDGCRIDRGMFPVGEKLWVSLPGLSPIEAEVRWATTAEMGLRFLSPLHPAVADHLINHAPAGARRMLPPVPRRGPSGGYSQTPVATLARTGWIAELRDPYSRRR